MNDESSELTPIQLLGELIIQNQILIIIAGFIFFMGTAGLLGWSIHEVQTHHAEVALQIEHMHGELHGR